MDWGALLNALLNERVPVPFVDPAAPYADESERVIVQGLARSWEPKEKIGIEEWCRANLTLTDGQTPEYGGEPLDFARVPHARLIIDFLNDPVAEELSIMKSSAAQFTTSTIGALMHRLKYDPCGILYLISDQAEAKKVAKKIWRPFLAQTFGAEIMGREDQANLHLQVNGVDVYSGAPSESLMRNKQVGVIVEDESDTLDDELSGGGNDLEVAQKERTKNSLRPKTIRLCTPLAEYDITRPKMKQPRARIHRNYLLGDQRKFWCPCPSCGMENELEEKDFHYQQCLMLDGSGEYDLDRVQAETVWKCPLCAHVVYDSSAEKKAMISAGRWVATARARSRRLWSAWHTDYISLIGSATWGKIASELERTRGTLQFAAVRRAHLAEPEKTSQAINGRERDMILKHCSDYDRGTCPAVPWRVALVSDVQHDLEKEKEFGGVHLRFPWMLAALAMEPMGAVYVIDWGEARDFDDLFLRDQAGKIHGRFAQPIPLRVSPAMWQRYYPGRAVEPHVYPSQGLIDSGFMARGIVHADEGDASTESVYGFCLRTFSRRDGRFLFCPVKGRAGRQIDALTVESTREVRGVNLPLYHYDDWAFKSDMHVRLSSDPAKPSVLARQRARIFLPRVRDVDEGHPADNDLISHLCAERLVNVLDVDKHGRQALITKWHTTGRNDWWDCLKWFLVYADILNKKAAMEAARRAS